MLLIIILKLIDKYNDLITISSRTHLEYQVPKDKETDKKASNNKNNEYKFLNSNFWNSICIFYLVV